MGAGDWPEVRCIRGGSLRVRLPPDKPVRVGPSYTSEMCLPAAPGSGVLLWDGEQVTLEPEDGGFEIAGKAVDGKVAVGDGTEISLGSYGLVIKWSGSGTTTVTSAPVAAEPSRVRLLAGDAEVERAVLRQGVSIGSDSTCDYRIAEGDRSAARRAYCVTVAETARGFQVEASGFEERGVLLNGQLFSRRELVLGDYLQVGPMCFRYDGEGGLVPCPNSLGASLHAGEIAVSYDGGHRWTLDGASLEVPAGHFVGILGPSGSGKTTLLRAVSDLLKADRGEVLIDGRPVPASAAARRSLIGFVPQDDIVHLDLTVHQALRFGARLRLPDSIPAHEIEKLIERVVGRIFFQWRDRDFENQDEERAAAMRVRLDELLGKRVGELSGGQRKRVSVAVELMSRPRILFLDEPTSGLDPASEQELMSMLRDVTNSGCSVICTTHVLENVWRMHSFAVVYGGKVIFQGDSATARSQFAVQDLSTIYQLLDKNPGRWKPVEAPAPESLGRDAPRMAAPSKKSPLLQGWLIVQRQFELLKRDQASIALLVGQPILIGIALSLVSVDEASIPYKLFFGLVVAFWFGCSNSAPQIVREKAILARERGVGLGVVPYLAAKFLFFGGLTILQIVVLWSILAIRWYPGVGTYPPDSGFADAFIGAAWQTVGAAGIGFCATAWGLAVSGWARRPAQASFVVPLLVIPQILFSGFVFPLDDWQGKDDDVFRERAGKSLVRKLAWLVPGYSGERIIETSLTWDQNEEGRDERARERAFDNLEFFVDEEDWREFVNGRETGVTWRFVSPAITSTVVLGVWTISTLALAGAGLVRKRS